jgi:hypothetical protein
MVIMFSAMLLYEFHVKLPGGNCRTVGRNPLAVVYGPKVSLVSNKHSGTVLLCRYPYMDMDMYRYT